MGNFRLAKWCFPFLLDFSSSIAITDWHESVIARPLVSLLQCSYMVPFIALDLKKCCSDFFLWSRISQCQVIIVTDIVNVVYLPLLNHSNDSAHEA